MVAPILPAVAPTCRTIQNSTAPPTKGTVTPADSGITATLPAAHSIGCRQLGPARRATTVRKLAAKPRPWLSPTANRFMPTPALWIAMSAQSTPATGSSACTASTSARGPRICMSVSALTASPRSRIVARESRLSPPTSSATLRSSRTMAPLSSAHATPPKMATFGTTLSWRRSSSAALRRPCISPAEGRWLRWSSFRTCSALRMRTSRFAEDLRAHRDSSATSATCATRAWSPACAASSPTTTQALRPSVPEPYTEISSGSRTLSLAATARLPLSRASCWSCTSDVGPPASHAELRPMPAAAAPLRAASRRRSAFRPSSGILNPSPRRRDGESQSSSSSSSSPQSSSSQGFPVRRFGGGGAMLTAGAGAAGEPMGALGCPYELA
mmetsp:Transcript_2833/g.8207  ORF Transcript_2833/g.8207 Transcript_2833/m.8207 type:complete len:385 (+) Transcript_2833:653-1807(+)